MELSDIAQNMFYTYILAIVTITVIISTLITILFCFNQHIDVQFTFLFEIQFTLVPSFIFLNIKIGT